MLEIVDPHIHIWDVATGLYPRRAQRRDAGDTNAGDYLPDDLLHDAAEVRLLKAVHVEAFPTDGLAEVRHLEAIAGGEEPPVRAIVANADLADPGVGSVLEELSRFHRVRGIRHALNRRDDDRDLLAMPEWHQGFALLSQHGLSFDLQLAPAMASDVARLAERHPETMIVLNHLGWPMDRSLAGWTAWRRSLRALAACENIWVKLSGVGMFEPDWTLESIRPYIFEALELFGAGRAMFASNFPVDKAMASYTRLWRAYAALVADLSDDERRRLLRGNAEQFYRI